ncbi:MAG: ATP-binding protein [Blastocatellales bacterium]
MNNSGITILNVDGGEAGLYVKSRILREAGYKVVEARTAADALRLVRLASPQLVLLSVNLPDLSGLEVGRRIKTDPVTAATLVLLVSASFVGCEKRARSLEDGADGYLLEPVAPEFLLANIKTLLRLRRDDTEQERLLAYERRQTWALKKLARSALAINSAASLDEILQLVTDHAREMIGAHQAVTNLAADVLAENVLAVNGCSPHAITAVSLSEKHEAWRDFNPDSLGERGAAWVCSLVCRLNQPMRLTQAEMESQFVRNGQAGETPRLLLEERVEDQVEDQTSRGLAALDQVITPREFATLRELAALRELASLRDVATPRELATLRALAALRKPRMLRGLEMSGWLAAPLTSRDGRNLGLIQLSDKYDGEFTEQDEAILAQMAQLVSIAIENRQLYRREQDQRSAAENAVRAKDEFLAMISHKLRTPLNAMLGWAWVLRRETCGAEAVARAAEIIERNARAQVRLVEELLEASRVITGKLRLDVRPLEIAPLVEAACGALCPAAKSKGVEMRLRIDPEAGTITGDPERLRQIVWNLLSNAIRFTPSGGRVELGLERAGGGLRLTVSDTGKGISADALPFVFDRFRRGAATGGQRSRGLGLGLALVRHLVELHGGSVSASSPGEGRGATFAINLPVSAAHLEQRAEQEKEAVGEWENGRESDDETRMWGEWENENSDLRLSPSQRLSLSPSPRFPVSQAPASVSRGVAAGGGC